MRNKDFLQGATIVLNPSGLTGEWSEIECLTDLTGISITDLNLTDTSLAWADAQYVAGMIRPGVFTSLTFTGKAVLYA